jgi:uncharacterized protein YbjT (DUF2867 family)
MTNPAKYLITGGGGVLGKELLHLFEQQAIPCIVASRTNPSKFSNWQHIDLENTDTLQEATANKEVIFHLASGTKKFSKNVDVEGTKRLLQKAKDNGAAHFVYISIVGIEKVPYVYYRYKLEAEQEIIRSGIPYTILRATQFHEFIDFIFQMLLKFPVAFVPKHIKVQPVHAKAVAQMLFDIGQAQPLNKTLNIGGREVLEAGDMAKSWLSAQHKTKLLLPLPLIGKAGNALNNGGLTCTEQAYQSITWNEWLQKKYKQV